MKEKLPLATHTGDLKIGDIILPCYVIEGGVRVLSARGVNTAFGTSLGSASGNKNLPRVLGSTAIQPYIPEGLINRLTKPIEFKPKNGGRSAFGYTAIMLPEICEVILDADKGGVLTNPKQGHIAEILIRGFARVGIVALVDEATGYQEIRKKDELAGILKAWIEQEKYRAWTLTFPLDFYELMFKLKGWNTLSPKLERPSVVGKYTNDIVYERLAPELLAELEKKNPVSESGFRKQKHHQWLSAELGHPRLREHLTAVMALMRASSTWEGFKRSLQRAFPKLNTNLEMNFEEDK